MVRKILHLVMRFLFAVLTRVDAAGLENIPQQGPAILAANHLGRLDAALIFMLVKRQDITGLVADKYKGRFFFDWLVNSVHGIWLNRESADLAAMREALNYIRRGGMLGIAPEGTRSHTGALIQAKTGVAYLADKSCTAITPTAIVPVAIWGTETAVAKIFRLARPRLHVRFGAPFTLPPVDRKDREGSLQRNTDEIMCQIACMLPEMYRGVYAQHPRLWEFLAYGKGT